MDALIRRLRPDLAIDRPSDDLGGFVRQESNTALDRTPAEWDYSASANTRWVVSSLPRTVSSNASVDFVDYPVRHVAASPERQELRLLRALANGGGLDYYVIGRLDDHADRSAFPAVRRVFAYHAAHEDDYRDLRPCAHTALLTGPHGNSEEFRGWFRVLVEHHMPFDTLLLDAVGEPVFARFRAVVLPGHEPISDETAAHLDRFVERGGVLIASGEVGLRSKDLEPRDAPALASLGIERIRAIRDSVRGAYLSVDDRAGFARLHDTDLVFVDGPYVDAVYRPGASGRLRLIPPGPFGPPERCDLPPPTDEPGVVVHPFGAGRAVFVPWSCGTLMERHGHANTSSFMADVLQGLGGLEPIGGNLSPMVEVTLLEHADRTHRLLHLVNGSGQLGAGCVEPVTMRGLEVTIPCSGAPTEVHSLVSGTELAWELRDGELTISLPELHRFEAIKIADGRSDRG